jgi:hypothetical protein
VTGRRASAAAAIALATGALALAGCGGTSHDEQMDKAIDNIERTRAESDRANAELQRQVEGPLPSGPWVR